MPTNSTSIKYNREELNAIIELDGHLKQFPPLLASAVAELRKKAADLDVGLLSGKSEKDWETMIGKVPGDIHYPDQYSAAPNPIEDYARDIAYRLTGKFPASAIIARIGATKIPNGREIKKILEKNTGFSITQQAAHTWFKVVDKPKASNEISKTDLEKIQAFQRCIKLTEGPHKLYQAEALMLSGITSAHRITTMGRFDFKQEMKKYALTEKELHFIYCRAKSISDSVNYLSVQHLRYDGLAAMVPGIIKFGAQPEDAPLQIPDLETIFGSLNTCSCTDCQSVYSAAAYLTDLLHWTKSDIVCDPGGSSAYNVLTAPARRGDIPYLLLNCKNTNTLMPYIDLVNEILAINLGSAPDYSVLQTTKETPQLLAQPEHRFNAEEALLKTAFFPWVLPYDAMFDEASTLLEKSGISQHELIHSLSTESNKYNTIYWAKAYLGLNDDEYKLIINNGLTMAASFWSSYWGLNGMPASIGPVLKNAGLTINELKELLATHFLFQNGTLVITINPPATDDCDIDKYLFNPGFPQPIAARLLRFLRLQRKCGLSVWELDLAIATIGVATINSGFLTKLSACMAFCEQRGISLPELMLWFNENPYQDLNTNIAFTFKPTPYYKKRFLNELLPIETIAFFDPAVPGNCTTKAILSLTQQEKQILASVLKTGITEIDLLIPYLGLSSASTQTLTPKYIAWFDRYIRFSAVMGVEILELLQLFSFIPDPLKTSSGSVTTDRIWDFTRTWDEFKKLDQQPSQFIDLVTGQGYYALDPVSDQAVDAKFALEAKDLWEKVKASVLKTRSAYPNGYDTANQPDTGQPTLAPALEPIVFEQLANGFELDVVTVQAIVNHSSAVWVKSFLGDTIAWDWSVLAGKFTLVYRLLKRVKLLSGICGLDAGGLQAGVEIKINTALQFPSDAFYWLTNSFPPVDVAHFIALRKVAVQAAIAGFTQYKHFKLIDALQHHSGNFSDADIQPFAKQLQTSAGPDSLLKKWTALEFADAYYRAQSIAGDYKNLSAVMDALLSVLEAVQITRATVAATWSWVWKDWPLGGNHHEASFRDYNESLRTWLRRRFDSDESWNKFITPIQNGFRDRLRDALVAWYIGRKGFKDSNAIYDHFLLDPEMAPCMKTSRMVLAISSVQLLIHRALMGLEPGICMDEDDKHEWEWRKNYRVWEANRKIFLYPENWIEPELRLDKSPFFKEAEDLLLQDEVNDENCEKAFANYLSNLNEAARLDIRGTFIDEKSDPEVLHVIARTWNPPYIHYYRNRKNDVWSAWEKMELDVEGDHVVPIVFNRRLYLFWFLFIEKEHRKIKRVIDGEEQNAPYYEIKVCYSKHEFGKWTNKKILDATMYSGHYSGKGMFNNLERKLGKGIPPGSAVIANNPNFNSFIWTHTEAPDLYSLHGPYTWDWASAETYRGNLVMDNANFDDYSYVSLDKKSFFFWGQVEESSGDLIIHCRRDFHPDWDWHDAYTELAYEDCFKISACNEKTEIILSPEIATLGKTDKRFLARPFFTVPDGMLMSQGLDRWNKDLPVDGLFVKKVVTPDKVPVPIFRRTNPSFTLTYPHQYKHALWEHPFFFSDKRHTFFLERKKDKRCVCTTGIVVINGKTQTVTDCSYKSFSTDKFVVTSHEHPYTCTLLSEFNRFGIKGLLDSVNQNIKRQLVKDEFFPGMYKPDTNYVGGPFPVNNYDFERNGAYSIYNWEIFFHLVTVVAKQLRQNNKFAEAIKWLQFVFDPTNREGSYGVQRVWNIKPFMIDVTNGSIQRQMRLLSSGNLNPAEEAERENLIAQIEEWRNDPFNPHSIASMRRRAYMLYTVGEYISTLTDWGDWLFRQDTMESINEATNLYILAAKLLGNRPQKIPKASNTDISFYQIANGLDPFSNIAVNMENQMPGIPFSSNCTCGSNYQGTSKHSLPDLLFCIPDNPKLLEYWNKVEDRLFKIRHCMNIEGVVRQLALFSPPIDPALLVRAKAMGLDIADILADLAAPPPHYRFSYLLQKAADFCNEVKSLGGQLLSAFEKKDAEELSLIRQVHEQNILSASRNLKKLQIEEAKQAMATLEHSKKLIEMRLADYENRAYVSSREQVTIDNTRAAEGFMFNEQGMNAVAGHMAMIPDVFIAAPTAAGSHIFGGSKLHAMMQSTATVFGILASLLRNKASMSATYAGYDRRQEDWDLQIKTAQGELNQVDVQLLGAEIRIAITEKELDNHDLQVEQSKEIYDWVKSKFTNQSLYNWMSGELKTMYRKAYDLAYDMAKQAQIAFQRELSTTETHVTFGNWESSRKGLLAGEQLSLQLKKLEASYMQLNKRGLELTKNVSMALLDPLALQELRTTGKCSLTIPEELYDLDYQGHYARRIKSVSISVPCIAGPYTTIGCTLRLLSNTVRISKLIDANNPYKSSGSNDPRFIVSNAPVNAIATSTGQRDSGMFELNFHDERYLPFEGAGAISEWKIELTQDVDLRQFDYSTIADVILHINYTAKEGESAFKENAVAHLINFLKTAGTAPAPLMRMFSMKHEFSTEWHKFLHPPVAGDDQILSFTLQQEHFPFFAKGRGIIVQEIEVLIKANRTGDYKTIFSANNNAMISGEIVMPPSTQYAAMQKATPTNDANIIAANLDVFKTMKLKFKYDMAPDQDPDYHSIDTEPEEISDIFVALHYRLS